MEDRNFLKDIYEDFFGVEKLKKENAMLAKELKLENKEYPTIEVKEKQVENTTTLEEQMARFEKTIEALFVTETSKQLLQKMVIYMKRYQEKQEKQYIPFSMCIYGEDKETVFQIIDMLREAATYFSYIPKGDTVETSFYALEKVEQLNEVYKQPHQVMVWEDMEAFLNKEVALQERFWHQLEERLEKQENRITIMHANNETIWKQALETSKGLQEKYFYFAIQCVKPDVQDIYQQVLERLKENAPIEETFPVALLDYVSATYPNTTLSYSEYRDTLCEKIIFHKEAEITQADLPTYEKEKTMEEIFEALNSLVGLQKVKQVLQDLVSLMELKQKTENMLTVKETNLHMVFLGNPGTGKTTVARLIAQILYRLKYIQQNKLIEVMSKDLVGEYVGQTGPKTMKVIEKALGGVLFIDEAYTLASSAQGNSYNEEAIATLIQAMENHRENLVVIFAGYTKEMQAFLNANSGIVSRIGYTLEFEDYTPEELVQIFKGMTKKAGLEVTEEAIEEVKKVIMEYKDTKNFGNARFVRNVYEKSLIQHAANTKGKTSKKRLRTITKEDISVENLLKM